MMQLPRTDEDGEGLYPTRGSHESLAAHMGDRTARPWCALIVVQRSASKDFGVLYTKDVDYQNRYTTVWVVSEQGRFWIRAAKPDRRWLADLRSDRNVRLEQNGSREYYRPVVARDVHTRERVDRLMRQKYGIADHVRRDARVPSGRLLV